MDISLAEITEPIKPSIAEQLLEATTPTAIIRSGASLWTNGWPLILDFLTRAHHAGDISNVWLDLDNCIYQPCGYLGSESQEWASTAALAPGFLASLINETNKHGTTEELRARAIGQARTLVLNRRNKVDEPRLLKHGLYELFGHLTNDRLLQLKKLHADGLAIIAISARPPSFYDQVLDTLAIVGIGSRGDVRRRLKHPLLEFDKVVLCSNTGSDKVAAIRDGIAELASSPATTVLIDDRRKNTVPVTLAGFCTILLQAQNPNYRDWKWQMFLQKALIEPQFAFKQELLLNALAKAESYATRNEIFIIAQKELSQSWWISFQEYAKGIDKICPLDS